MYGEVDTAGVSLCARVCCSGNTFHERYLLLFKLSPSAVPEAPVAPPRRHAGPGGQDGIRAPWSPCNSAHPVLTSPVLTGDVPGLRPGLLSIHVTDVLSWNILVSGVSGTLSSLALP